MLVALTTSIEGIGLAGPMSNYAAAPQLVETVPYRLAVEGGARSAERRAPLALSAPRSALHPQALRASLSALHAFAKNRRAQHDKKWVAVERLGGFCLLIRRAVLNRLGAAINEWSDLGLFDTDILSMKAREAGFRLAVCRDLFVHHFGTRTFAHGTSPA